MPDSALVAELMGQLEKKREAPRLEASPPPVIVTWLPGASAQSDTK
jgi:hypothetical protein